MVNFGPLAVSRLGSITALHSTSGCQANFAALNRGRFLYSAGRPSHWALAHILVGLVVEASEVPRVISRVIIFDARQRQ